ncbi:TRIM3 [Branchiostoma lanceolatum]|uniref:TRIM3 protein n=1 Tax=Branchiostoma lanceolatum TaxID=7740 RepID=A0A8J9ZTZ9_BRALA|nr:TRIM3 [Branchiostoma lanceolatum]
MDAMNKTDDDSTSDTGYEVPNNMEDTQSDLPHIRDSSDSTTEPADGYDMQPQLHQVPTNPGEQKDISPGHAEDPSRDVHSDASTEYSNKDDGLGCSPDKGEERSSLPTICTSYINISKTEQNQTLYDERPSLPAVGTANTQLEQNKAIYVDNPFVEKEESPPKDIYNTKGCNTNNVAQYHLKNTSRKEASATAYQCGGDDARVDRPDVQVHDADSKAQEVNQDETRPKTVTKESKNAESCDQNNAESTAVSDDECIRPYAIAYQRDGKRNGEPYAIAYDEEDETRLEPVIEQSEDAGSSDQNIGENSAVSDDECIRPYAAAYCQDGEANGEQDVQPYAVAYDEQDEHYENQTPTGHSVNNTRSVRGKPAAGTSSEAGGGKMDGLRPNQGNALRPNPMYSGDALRHNPMYAPNAVQPRAGGDMDLPEANETALPGPGVEKQRQGHKCVVSRTCLACVITNGVVVAILTVLSALIIAIFISERQGSQMETAWTDPTFIGKTTDAVTQHMGYTSSPQTSTEEKENSEAKQSKIVFGKEGEEVGQFSDPSAVVVSPDNEIFVADFSNRRVQVFNMTGAYLRHFPTIVSEDDSGTIEPNEVSIDGEGHLWVLGDDDSWAGFIVRYTKVGRLLTTFQATLSNSSLLGMAVDTLRDIVVVTESWKDTWGNFEYGQVKLLHFNGKVVRKFRTGQGPQSPGRVAVGREGNLFFTDHMGGTRVYVYNNTGHYLFSLVGDKIGEGQTEIDDGQAEEVSGVCTDSSGNILVAYGLGGTVDLFTKVGRYFGRVVSGMFRADSIAVAPEAAILLPLTLLVISLGSRDDK